MLGIGALEPAGVEPPRSIVERLLDMTKDPVRAVLVIFAGLVWFLTMRVDASQTTIKDKLDAQAKAIANIQSSVDETKEQRRVTNGLLLRICIGVSKGSDKDRCGQ